MSRVPGIKLTEGSFVFTIEKEAGKGLTVPCGPGAKVHVLGKIEMDPDSTSRRLGSVQRCQSNSDGGAPAREGLLLLRDSALRALRRQSGVPTGLHVKLT